MAKLTLPLHFKLREFQPDKRKYKAAMPVFEPIGELIVVVDVPFEREYIYNLEDIILKQTSGEKEPAPMLTPLGWAYVEDAFLTRIDKPEPEEATEDLSEIKWEGDE